VFLFSTFSLSTLLDAYFAPYLIFSAWLSLVTFLQHSDPQAVYYRDGEWTYLKVRSLPRRAVSVSVGYQKGQSMRPWLRVHGYTRTVVRRRL
jgi:fatty acid desaturase